MSTKYKFEEVTGCTSFDFLVNGKSLSDIPKNDQDQILDYLFVKIKEGIKEVFGCFYTYFKIIIFCI
jgi:hypothetical protein